MTIVTDPSTGMPRVHFGATTPEGVVHMVPAADGLRLEFHSYGKVVAAETVSWERLDQARAAARARPAPPFDEVASTLRDIRAVVKSGYGEKAVALLKAMLVKLDGVREAEDIVPLLNTALEATPKPDLVSGVRALKAMDAAIAKAAALHRDA